MSALGEGVSEIHFLEHVRNLYLPRSCGTTVTFTCADFVGQQEAEVEDIFDADLFESAFSAVRRGSRNSGEVAALAQLGDLRAASTAQAILSRDLK